MAGRIVVSFLLALVAIASTSQGGVLPPGALLPSAGVVSSGQIGNCTAVPGTMPWTQSLEFNYAGRIDHLGKTYTVTSGSASGAYYCYHLPGFPLHGATLVLVSETPSGVVRDECRGTLVPGSYPKGDPTGLLPAMMKFDALCAPSYGDYVAKISTYTISVTLFLGDAIQDPPGTKVYGFYTAEGPCDPKRTCLYPPPS
jgi:hypothetical protein